MSEREFIEVYVGKNIWVYFDDLDVAWEFALLAERHGYNYLGNHKFKLNECVNLSSGTITNISYINKEHLYEVTKLSE